MAASGGQKRRGRGSTTLDRCATKPTEVVRHELADRIFQLRIQCKPIRDIAAQLTAEGHPIGKTRVQEILANELAKGGANPERREAVRAMMLERLDKMTAVWLPAAELQDPQATEIVLKIEKQRADLLRLHELDSGEQGESPIAAMLRRVEERKQREIVAEAEVVEPEKP